MIESSCPAVSELQGELPEALRPHVGACLRCRAVLRALDRPVPPKPAHDVHAELPLRSWRASTDPALGSVCAVMTPQRQERLICLVTGLEDGVVDVVPLSDEVEYASDCDLLLDASVLGYQTIAETWNAGALLVEQVDELLAELDHAAWDHLVALLDGDGEDDKLIDVVGPPIVSEADPRWGFHSREAERARPFYAAAAELAGISGLPALLLRKTEDVPVDRLADRLGGMVADRPDWVEALAADELQIAPREVPEAAVAELLGQLDLSPSARLASIVEGSVTGRAAAASRIYLMRTGSPRKASSRRPRKTAARQYAERVMDALVARQERGSGSGA
jgi:hypothetical protein